MTWKGDKNGETTYKASGKPDKNGDVKNTYDSINADKNNIENVNKADVNLERNEYLKKYNSLDLSVEHYVGDIVKTPQTLTSEGSKFSKFFNDICGMNAMSIMHDKWTDSNVGLFGGILTNTPLLELFIFPAISITYVGLVIGGTMNDL